MSFSYLTRVFAPKLAPLLLRVLAEEQTGEDVVTGDTCQRGFGGVEES